MAKEKKSKLNAANSPTSVVDALRIVLADHYALMAQTHLCHWNVEGPGFFALHAAFEAQYTELFNAIDEIAERIRSLGSYAPGGLASLAGISGMKEFPESGNAPKMVAHLAQLHKQLIRNANSARDLAADANDKETEDLMIGRVELHQKTLWMLDSYLKG